MRALAVVFVLGCTHGQMRTAHRVGEITTAGGLAGVLACATGAAFDQQHEKTFLTVGAMFVPISVLGALMYIATDREVNHDDGPPPPTRRERVREAAWELTKQAAEAARAQDCTQVQAISPRVHELDSEFHGSVFMRDAAILRCMHLN
jgi:hypothetical protein